MRACTRLRNRSVPATGARGAGRAIAGEVGRVGRWGACFVRSGRGCAAVPPVVRGRSRVVSWPPRAGHRRRRFPGSPSESRSCGRRRESAGVSRSVATTSATRRPGALACCPRTVLRTDGRTFPSSAAPVSSVPGARGRNVSRVNGGRPEREPDPCGPCARRVVEGGRAARAGVPRSRIARWVRRVRDASASSSVAVWVVEARLRMSRHSPYAWKQGRIASVPDAPRW